MIEHAHVLVTGAAGDIGSALVECFLKRGHRVLGLDISTKMPEGFPHHDRFSYYPCDLTDTTATAGGISAFVAKYGAIQIVINNVGLIYNCPIVSYSDGELKTHPLENWDKVLAVTLTTAFNVTRLCLPSILENGEGGVVINISSISANGNPGQSAYSAAKGAINSMTISQAKELGPLGVRVAAIAPGFIDTPSTLKAMGPEALKKLRRAIPLRRLGQVTEVCHAVVFIVENQYFTGSVLELTGGLSI